MTRRNAGDRSGADGLFAGRSPGQPSLFVVVNAGDVKVDGRTRKELSQSVRNRPGSRDQFLSRKQVGREASEIDTQPESVCGHSQNPHAGNTAAVLLGLQIRHHSSNLSADCSREKEFGASGEGVTSRLAAEGATSWKLTCERRGR